MLLPSLLDRWYAEAVTRVYAPWLTSNCTVIGARHRQEVTELIRRARRAACLPPLDTPTARFNIRAPGQQRSDVGRWTRGAA